MSSLAVGLRLIWPRPAGVDQPRAGVEILGGHQQRPREALGLLLVVDHETRASGVDRMAVEAQRGDEAPVGMVRFERPDMGRVVDALGGGGSDAATVKYETHMVSWALGD
jgi:hypothetical protein